MKKILILVLVGINGCIQNQPATMARAQVIEQEEADTCAKKMQERDRLFNLLHGTTDAHTLVACKTSKRRTAE
ncbi:MAG: hypothetical protein WCW31_04550 [Patescibacteria group bacterium]|jgi:hypothetical protein